MTDDLYGDFAERIEASKAALEVEQEALSELAEDLVAAQAKAKVDLHRAIQTALEVAADRVARQYLPTRIGGDLICDPVQGEASADAIRSIRVEDVLARLEKK